MALTFCSAVTERIRLIPNIAVLPYRHPLIVAKMVATMAMLSEDRFTLAVATGYLRGEYKGLGIDFEQRNALFDQAVEVLRGMWTEDDFSFSGIGIDAKGLTANPKPRTPPPIWIGGNSRLSRRRVARYGDGWTPFPAPRTLSTTTKTPPLETVEDLSGHARRALAVRRRGGAGPLGHRRRLQHPGRRQPGRALRRRCPPGRARRAGHAGRHLGRGVRSPAARWRRPSRDWSATERR